MAIDPHCEIHGPYFPLPCHQCAMEKLGASDAPIGSRWIDDQGLWIKTQKGWVKPMAIDPKDVKEGECLHCGKLNSAHVEVAIRGGLPGLSCGFFRPKPPAPKAKPGVMYQNVQTKGIGLVNGLIFHLDRYACVPFTPDWQEVE